MKTLDIVFTKSKKKFPIVSRLICWWTNKPYSHVARAIEIRDWGKRYFQASEGKVNYEFEKYFLKKHEIVKKYTLEVCPAVDKKIKYECYIEAGNSYAMTQNLGIAWLDILFKLFGKKFNNPWTKGRNCSELLYIATFKQLIPGLDKIYSENTIKPHEIEEIILNNFEKGEDSIWRLK